MRPHRNHRHRRALAALLWKPNKATSPPLQEPVEHKLHSDILLKYCHDLLCRCLLSLELQPRGDHCHHCARLGCMMGRTHAGVQMMVCKRSTVLRATQISLLAVCVFCLGA